MSTPPPPETYHTQAERIAVNCDHSEGRYFCWDMCFEAALLIARRELAHPHHDCAGCIETLRKELLDKIALVPPNKKNGRS
jgi:Fe-S-cluster-containing hydrogenase component 2